MFDFFNELEENHQKKMAILCQIKKFINFSDITNACEMIKTLTV